MRVMYLCWSYPTPEQPFAGSFFRNQVTGLVKAGVDVEVVAPVPWIPRWLALANAKWQDHAKIPRKLCSENVRISFPRFIYIPKISREHMDTTIAWAVSQAGSNGIDLIHAHAAYPYGTAALRIAGKSNIPVVLTLHGWDVNDTPYLGRPQLERFCTTIRNATKVLAVSQALADKTYELSAVKPEFSPIGIDLKRFSQRVSKDDLRKQLGLPMKEKIILMVGHLIIEKGVQELLAALKCIQARAGIKALFLGDGPLRSEITAAGHYWLGRISNALVADYMCAADVVTLPSRPNTEGMPTVLVEAGAVQTPVVATGVDGIPELLGDRRGYLVDHFDHNGLVDAIETALTDRKDAEMRAERLHTYVQTHYNVEKNSQQLATLYSGIIQNQHAKHSS